VAIRIAGRFENGGLPTFSHGQEVVGMLRGTNGIDRNLDIPAGAVLKTDRARQAAR
jgi:hypothetical protein